MKICLTILLITTWPCINLAQSPFKLAGKVIDVDTHEPLSFASLSIKGKPIGTVTNADGEFYFYIPAQHAEDTLTVSFMGYDRYKALVKDIAEIKSLTVKLKFTPILLSEVVITGTKLNATEIITKAFENIENNYSLEPYTFKAFYRETHQENDRSVILVEAALDIYDNGYKPIHGDRSRIREKVIPENIRASKSYRHSLFKNTVIEKHNLVISALRCNPLKYRNPDILRSFQDQDFMMDSVIYLNNDLVYVVSFYSYIPRYPLFERKNTLYIDAQNFSIYKYIWEEYPKKGKYSEPPWPLSKDSIYLSWRRRISSIYEYENYGGKMYLKYFNEKCYDDIYNAKGNLVEFEALGQTTLVVTEIKTGKVKIESQRLMKHDRSIYAQSTPYEPEFWNNYEHLVPLTKKQVRDLEWEIPLKEQFVNER